MRYMPKLLSEEQTQGMYNRIQDHFHKYGYGRFAVELLSTGEWIGFIGFDNVRFDTTFTPAVEIGYRLISKVWNQGLGTEGSLACLKYAEKHLPGEKIVSFTAKINLPSQRVMQKIGLKYQEEFDHPLLDPSDPLYRHVLYTL